MDKLIAAAEANGWYTESYTDDNFNRKITLMSRGLQFVKVIQVASSAKIEMVSVDGERASGRGRLATALAFLNGPRRDAQSA